MTSCLHGGGVRESGGRRRSRTLCRGWVTGSDGSMFTTWKSLPLQPQQVFTYLLASNTSAFTSTHLSHRSPLPSTLKHLILSNMCPLPSSISDCPLPPLLEHVHIELAPFSANGKTTILPTPLDFSHLTQLTELFLDGGEETSNLVSPPFFSSLMNATGIQRIILQYCVVYSFDFPDFIRWFFGDWRVRGGEKGDREDGSKIGDYLEMGLFFGEWSEEEIVIARSTMEEYPRTKGSGIWEPGEGEE
ncbi:hypothetical protein BT69DRAFT_1028065 [Atractiella rhizophila]|nr:hypothetical protein BT69DRAFT_1028065 [Atractiella rhizophila]